LPVAGVAPLANDFGVELDDDDIFYVLADVIRDGFSEHAANAACCMPRFVTTAAFYTVYSSRGVSELLPF